MHDGWRPLDPPTWWLRLFERRADVAEATEEEVHLNRPEIAPAPEVR